MSANFTLVFHDEHPVDPNGFSSGPTYPEVLFFFFFFFLEVNEAEIYILGFFFVFF